MLTATTMKTVSKRLAGKGRSANLFKLREVGCDDGWLKYDFIFPNWMASRCRQSTRIKGASGNFKYGWALARVEEDRLLNLDVTLLEDGWRCHDLAPSAECSRRGKPKNTNCCDILVHDISKYLSKMWGLKSHSILIRSWRQDGFRLYSGL